MPTARRSLLAALAVLVGIASRASGQGFTSVGHEAIQAPPAAARIAPQFVEWPRGRGGMPEEFRTKAGGAMTRVRGDGFASTTMRNAGDAKAWETIAFQLEGANANILLEGADLARARSHLLRGGDPKSWTPDLRSFGAVLANQAYPGVDVVWHFSSRGELEYDFQLKSGIDAASIVFRVDGAKSLSIDGDGNLCIEADLGTIRQSAPIATEEGPDGAPRRVPCAFRAIDSQRYGFVVECHDSAHALRIDPGIVYSTLLGGTILEQPAAIDVDGSGSAYLTGRTAGDFPTTPGAFQSTFGGGFWGDAFLTKLDPSGGSLVYSTYVGGSLLDWGKGVSVDGNGSATIALLGGSPELPTTPGCYQSQLGGCYVAKFDPSGSSLIFGTNFGGNGVGLRGLAVDSQGNSCIGGEVTAPSLPATPGAFNTNYGGNWDGYAAKLDPTGSSLVFATYVGGSSMDVPYSLTADTQGAVYLAGETASTDYPMAGNPFQAAIKGPYDCFVTKVSPLGNSLDYSTYLGGSQVATAVERALGIAVDKWGCAYVVGYTPSLDFPFTPGGIDTGVPPVGAPTFVAKLTADGSALVYADRFSVMVPTTVLYSESIAVNDDGCAVFCGDAWQGYLVTPDALSYPAGNHECFVTVLSPLGLGVTYSTLYGGTKKDAFQSLALDSQGHAYLFGGTTSPDFPTTLGAFDTTLADPGGDLCIVKMSLPSLPYGTASYGLGTPGCYGPHVLRTEASVKGGNGAMTLECNNVPASSLGLILVSDLQDVNGSDPLFLGVPFHVGLSPNVFGLSIVSTTPNLASLTVPLPNLSGLVGSTFYAQVFWLWPASTCAPSQFCLSASNGLAITVIL